MFLVMLGDDGEGDPAGLDVTSGSSSSPTSSTSTSTSSSSSSAPSRLRTSAGESGDSEWTGDGLLVDGEPTSLPTPNERRSEWLLGSGGKLVTSLAFAKGAQSLGNTSRTLHPPSFSGGTCGLSSVFSLLLLLVSVGTDC